MEEQNVRQENGTEEPRGRFSWLLLDQVTDGILNDKIRCGEYMYYLLNCLSRVKQILFCLFLSISIFMGMTYIHHDFSLRNILATPIIILLCIGCGEWGILGVSKTGRSIKVFEESTKVYDFVTLFIILVGSKEPRGRFSRLLLLTSSINVL